ncbi:N-formylglutamate amidohydrolase [Allopusillimonas soli]|uniref:N-formylglutamate amidohydrolase n=1 Tax=Allopusillimonas soli TaxID=659016 RepID=A0A853F8A5_9BURK|nr:N-formylglutamate amidohydrolase [Allopusillimonas soli]NYT36189.1 N-formylglutamate amidohydrolase [Allopusillimonas soli]TEA76520.1 N-formylglutamate amidohydrolase [Allopusillimonas soli]
MHFSTQPLSYRYIAPDNYPASDNAAPLVLDSPHSGTDYPPDFDPAIALGPLRTAEDTWVADLWNNAPAQGVPLLAARFPRSYIDANRGPEEIDPQLLAQPWPEPLPESPKVKLGKGLIWRMMDDGTPLYSRKLSHDEVRHRIQACWEPYHEALKSCLDAAHARFGQVWHINCHSMPSVAGAYATDKPGLVHPDFVLGDRDGATAAPAFREFVAEWLRARGYDVAVNDPYKGVEIVRRHGDPANGRHSLQVEVNRKLYMDEISLRPNAGYEKLRADLRDLVAALVVWTQGQTG